LPVSSMTEGVFIPQCTRKQVLKIRELRRQGYTYEQIGYTVHRGTTTVNRYDRLLTRYGIGVFAERG